jgi:HD superfamily phosphohydrolase
MADPHRSYEIRCPLHGFIRIDDWEREIINHPAFQRLRRIRQLAWTDMVYPGGVHARFEHSLGVMHVATQLYDAIVERSRKLLETELTYDESGFRRDKKLVRLAGLLHDVGHTPFSHAAEELFPTQEDGKAHYRHEHYSAAIIRNEMRDVIESHPLNQNYGLQAENIAALLEGSVSAGRSLFWRELIDGQMDADRIDYLLRDSLHTGVDYGKFDYLRLVNSVEAIRVSEGRGLRLGVSEGGFHAAEGLVLARYFMFTQVYFHKTRMAFDHHLQQALSQILPKGVFPRPTDTELAEFLRWDDWRVLGALANNEGGEHGQRLANRNHYREVYHTPESPKAEDLLVLDRVRPALGELLRAEQRAEKSWYKVGKPDIPVISDNPGRPVLPLSRFSTFVGEIQPTGKVILYSRYEDVDVARQRFATFWRERNEPARAMVASHGGAHRNRPSGTYPAWPNGGDEVGLPLTSHQRSPIGIRIPALYLWAV